MKRILMLSIFILLATFQIYTNKEIFEKIIESEWELMYDALCAVESEFDSLAYNNTADAAGIIQIRPIYVEDVNRIQGTEYTLEDRYSPVKSREMFEIYQSYYNPERDIEKAIRMHLNGCNNYNINDWYFIRVTDVMKKLRKESLRFYILL